jgi:EAL domain-containing protein (putative c-di-GMP-specific phosphodiesterase class I)
VILLVVGEPTVQRIRRLEDAVGEAPTESTPVAPDAIDAAGPATQPQPSPADDPERALSEGAVAVRFRPLRTLPELELCGVEAELCWRHPERGLLPADQWPQPLPSALADGLAETLFMAACLQFVRWQRRLDHRGVGTLWLRLPNELLQAPGVDDALSRALSASGMAATRLRLRVAALGVGPGVRLPDAAQRLQRLGVGLAVDGFGAGPASLAHLQQLPLRAVCLDRSFIERACHSAPQRLVVESTARLAAQMGIPVLADGVATEAQVLALGTLGCQLGVGEVCGPWLEADHWTQRWAATAPTGAV